MVERETELRFCGWSSAHTPDPKLSVVIVFLVVLRKDKDQGYSEPTLDMSCPTRTWVTARKVASWHLRNAGHSVLPAPFTPLCPPVYVEKCVHFQRFREMENVAKSSRTKNNLIL